MVTASWYAVTSSGNVTLRTLGSSTAGEMLLSISTSISIPTHATMVQMVMTQNKTIQRHTTQSHAFRHDWQTATATDDHHSPSFLQHQRHVITQTLHKQVLQRSSGVRAAKTNKPTALCHQIWRIDIRLSPRSSIGRAKGARNESRFGWIHCSVFVTGSTCERSGSL
jgi:hypothetical protein